MLKAPDLYNVFTAEKTDMLLVLRLSPKGPFLLLFYFLGWESRSLYKGQKSLSERIGADIGFQVNREIINFPGFHQEKSYQTDKCSDLQFLLHAKFSAIELIHPCISMLRVDETLPGLKFKETFYFEL